MLAGATSRETVGAGLVLVPVGSTEQHGPHLPLETDTLIATAVAQGVAARLGGTASGVWVAPPIAYGSSGEHQSFRAALYDSHVGGVGHRLDCRRHGNRPFDRKVGATGTKPS